MEVKLNDLEILMLHEVISNEKSNFILTIKEDLARDKLLILTADQADELRDLCGDYLSVIGFDSEYKPNTKGKILEGLIDKLYIE